VDLSSGQWVGSLETCQQISKPAFLTPVIVTRKVTEGFIRICLARGLGYDEQAVAVFRVGEKCGLSKRDSVMATTQEILDAARALGKRIATHDAARKFEECLTKLGADRDAQRLLNDLNRHTGLVAEKEQKGQPIEVDDKRKLEKLQSEVVQNSVLREFQILQMDYLDLMRKVDEAISVRTETSPAVPTAETPVGKSDAG